jgi:hypothetical protein
MCARAGELEHVFCFSRLCGWWLMSKIILDPGAGMLPAAGTTKLALTLAAWCSRDITEAEPHIVRTTTCLNSPTFEERKSLIRRHPRA